MILHRRGLALAAIQLALVLSVAAKYAWERQHCPNVWTRTAQYDPDAPLRGRYLALQLTADACLLPRDGHEEWDTPNGKHHPELMKTSWEVVTAARDGKLTGKLVPGRDSSETETLVLWPGSPCSSARLSDTTEFFISERAKTPFPLAKGSELWALVTVPPQGPPRPVKLAVSDSKGFHPLDLR
jgi:hypothetical protein